MLGDHLGHRGMLRGALAGGLVAVGAVVLLLGLLLGLPWTGFITQPGSPLWVLGSVAAFAFTVAIAGLIVLRPLRVLASRAIVAGLVGHTTAFAFAAALFWLRLFTEPTTFLLAGLAIGCAVTIFVSGTASPIKLALVAGGFTLLAAGLPFFSILLPDFVIWMIALGYAPSCWAVMSLIALGSRRPS